jgi:hypothetical protein
MQSVFDLLFRVRAEKDAEYDSDSCGVAAPRLLSHSEKLQSVQKKNPTYLNAPLKREAMNKPSMPGK